MTTAADSTTTTVASSGERGEAPGLCRSADGAQAAARVIASKSIDVEIPGVGRIRLPSLAQIAFLGGIATLAVLEIMEWPVAVVLDFRRALTAGWRVGAHGHEQIGSRS